MKKMKTISAILMVFVTSPIWYYLLHSVLTAINATPLEWFLYWVYVPIGLLVGVIYKIAEGK